MNFIKKLFGAKTTMICPAPTAHTPTYTIGWSIYTKDGSILSRQYEDVSFTEKIEIIELIKKNRRYAKHSKQSNQRTNRVC